MRHHDGRSGCREKWPDRQIGHRLGRQQRRKHAQAACGFPGQLLPSTPLQSSSGEMSLKSFSVVFCLQSLGDDYRVVERPFLDGVPRAETEKRS